MRLHSAMMLAGGGYDRRDSMPVAVQQSHPLAHVPLVLGVLRRLEVATVSDRLILPHPAQGLSCGRGGEALGDFSKRTSRITIQQQDGSEYPTWATQDGVPSGARPPAW